MSGEVAHLLERRVRLTMVHKETCPCLAGIASLMPKIRPFPSHSAAMPLKNEHKQVQKSTN